MADREDTPRSSSSTDETLPAAPGTPAARSPFPVTGWARYELLSVLGEGGMGSVYLAVDPKLDRKVALKFIRGDDPTLTLRLLQEARAQARVDRPGVCKVFEVGEVEGKAYIAMELVDGRSIDEAAREMSLHQKVQAVRDVARALHEAHVHGVVHRDVKPSNILVEALPDGALRPVVMDFGIARDEGAGRLTETGATVGTPAYMSPEQALGDRHRVDRRSDVYSLGATLYEVLAGTPPFEGGHPFALVHAVLTKEPEPLRARVPSLPEDLETIVSKCLRKEPGQRYDSARALAEDLDRYIRGEPILGRRESVVARLRRRAKQHRALVLVAALAVIALGAAGGLGVRARIVAGRHAAELAAEAELGRELGQEVKEMEWFLRSAKLLPLHDLTRERAVVKDRMKRIEARASAGPAAAAMIDYAVGRGHLALDEDAEAVTRLEHAERGGLDTPELHYALGLARGRLYQKALLDAQRLPDKHSVERRLAEIEGQYLKPALASMEKSHEAREAPSYLPALLTFYRKDNEGALRLAEKAHEEAPWLYEAVELQADVLLARGTSEENGDHDAAARDLEEAARLYDVAAESGRSDAGLYEKSAVAWLQRLHMGLDPAESLAHTIDRCEKAAIARPDDSTPYTKMAMAFFYMVFHLDSANLSLMLARGLAAADRARALGGDDAELCRTRSNLLWARAADEVLHGFDPTASLDQSVVDAQRALNLTPMSAAAHYSLVNSFVLRAQHVMWIGADPEKDAREAIDNFLLGYAIDGGYAAPYLLPLVLYGDFTQWKATRGRDPSGEAAHASSLFAACVKADAVDRYCYENMGKVDRGLAEYQIAAGVDAREALARAVEHLEKSRALSPDALLGPRELAAVHLLRAADAVHRGEDPAPSLEAFGQVVAGVYRLAGKESLCTILDARRELLLADIDASARRPERPALDRARALGLLAVERSLLDPHAPPDAVELAGERKLREADADQVLAEAERRLAALPAPPAEQTKHRAAGLDACTRGLAVNPNHPRLLATQGGLLLLEARTAQDAATTETARKARDALRRAVDLNPLLRREVGMLLDEAEHMAG